MAKLCQIIAAVNGKKTEVNRRLAELHKKVQKADLLDGFTRSFAPKDAEGETFPAECKRIQVKADDVIKAAAAVWTNFINLVAEQDIANCSTRADIVVDEKVVASQVPPTHLMFILHQLDDMRTFLTKLPVLDPAKEWTYDQNSGCHRTAALQQNKTRKEQRALVLYPATTEHPAQTQLISEDVTIGTWSTTYLSAALEADKKQMLIERLEKLIIAVKFAREKANQIDTERQEIGKNLFEYLMG